MMLDDLPITKLSNTVDGKFKFGMEITNTMIDDAFKKIAGYKYYKAKKVESEKAKAIKEPKEHNVPPIRSGRGKGYMHSGKNEANFPKLFKKNDVPRKTRTLTVAEETIAVELAKSISIKEPRTQQRRRSQLTIDSQIDEDVADTYAEMGDKNLKVPQLMIQQFSHCYTYKKDQKLADFKNGYTLTYIFSKYEDQGQLYGVTPYLIYKYGRKITYLNMECRVRRLRRKTFISYVITGSKPINRGLIQAILTSLPPQPIGEATKASNLRRIPPGIFLDYRVTLGFGSTGGLDLACPINRLSCHDGIQWVLGRITNSLPGTMAGVDIDTLTMEQYLALSRENQAPGVVKPEIRGNVNFKIKSQFMRELREDTFSGNKDEDAHDHIDRVLSIVGLFNIPGVTKDAVMLRVFPFTLTGAAKRWVDRLAPGTINTWDLLKKAFIQRYCPPSMTAKQLEDIHNFKQEGDESLYQAWERYNDLLYKCPTHDINSHQKTGQSSHSNSEWHDGTTSRNIKSSGSKDGLATLVNKLDNLGRDMKKLKETPFNGSNGGKFRVGPPGYYTKIDNHPPYAERRQSLEELLAKHQEKSAQRSTEMEVWIKKVKENVEINK
ncbi:hypothetical protein Tco_0619998 [Tanacetum coccineum]